MFFGIRPLKWLECWWSHRHVPCSYVDRRGRRSYRCVRCGVKL